MPAIVVDCTDLDEEMRFFTDRVGFRVRLVTPADSPRRVVLERDGLELELRRSEHDRPVRLSVDDALAREVRSPGGSIVEHRVRTAAVVVPPNRPSLTVVDADDGGFGDGRAGMRYRDLLPDRWGGRFIASHIVIEDGGDVADWVHFHRIRFQMIYVVAGWVDVVYEGQGEAFRMTEGDCVLQPPEIRHRVLRSSPGLEVIEIGCPAEHDTLADHDQVLPTPTIESDRDFSGQRFVRHVSDPSASSPWADTSMRFEDTGIGAATGGLAGAIVVASAGEASSSPLTHDGEFVIVVGLRGDARLAVDGREVNLTPRTSIAIPGGTTWSWSHHTRDHRALVVSLPADAVRSE